MERLVDELGEPWTAVFPNSPYPNIGILTKQKVIPTSVENTTAGVHARIQFPQGFYINFWAFHGWHKSYGPHAAFNRLVTNLSQIIAGEFAPKEKGTGRAQNVREVLQSESMKRDLKDLDEMPMFILGDFNSPSHQDWIQETKNLHSDWVVPWPSTKQLTDEGFIDSYRELYPDPVKQPGYTWSPVAKTNYEWDFVFPDPQDRIDFVFYKGKVKPEKIELYAGKETLKMMPDHFYNDYPSDHYAVIADFVFRESESEKKE
ncbi:unnamed protein product, partial [Mesorhabditis belari]|uniref:Endonuclease/exonuclease/phosphatase domain-containing protein n=1 Tax=Mesorhabditis belari TaxID=2138241 RepID=A0AAF3F753_9BILA